MKDKEYTKEQRQINGSKGGIKRAENAGENIGAKWSTIGVADWVLEALDKQRGKMSRIEYIRKLLDEYKE